MPEPNLKFVKITDIYSNEWNECFEFAKSFNHDISKTRLPIIMVKDSEKIISYFQVISLVTMFPAFSPEYSTPRLTREAALAMIHWSQMEFGEAIIAHRPEKSPFSESLLLGLHLEKQDYNLWKKDNSHG